MSQSKQSPSSSTFRVELKCRAPSDPTPRKHETPQTTAYRLSNDRLELGLRLGFRQVEMMKGRRGSQS
jgi:hypothetical protein